ncbi:MAG: cation:proton antiporter [Candidatus Makaraimicrobium thalassicum]|nr:MAG: cation:proton antiporter [Candidatus Omnitrophota bacterium]
MEIFIIVLFSWFIYLALTVGSGGFLLWSPEEILFGILFAVLSTLLIKKLFSMTGMKPGLKCLNPKRWLLFLVYVLGPFFFSMVRANLDVAYRVITGKIKPGIVRISSGGLRTDFGLTMLANSISLTPGTLTVDVDRDNLYVHQLYVRNKESKTEEICSSMSKLIGRMTE